ncbi:MAG: hypothetical protein AAF614_04860 [Chloroflexota bacterium]
MQHARYTPLLAIVTLFLLQWLFWFNPNAGVWDGAFYYAFARSPLFDQDLDLTNDLVLSYPHSTEDFVSKEMEKDLTETGRVASPFAIGSSVLWMPWLTIAKLSQLGLEVTGYEWWFVGPTAVFSAVLGLVAFWVAYRLLQAETDDKIALLTTLTFMVATPLVYYQFREPLYSHTTAVLANTLCIYVWWKEWRQQAGWAQAAKLGALIGFATLVRWQYLVYLLLPAMSAFYWLWDSDERKTAVLPIIKHLFIVGLAALIIISPQLAVWQLFYGSWITVPQGGAYVDWAAPNILSSLFSPLRGLFPWMPIVLPAFVGLGILLRQRTRLAIPLVLLLLLEIYVNGSTADWFAGGGYGPRRYTGELVVFMLGYATFLAAIAPRLRWLIGLGIGGFVAIHQLTLLRFGLLDRLGGLVLSMYPTYEWLEVSWGDFLTSLWTRLPTAVFQPKNFFFIFHSPLDWLQHGRFPFIHLGSLVLTAVYLLLLALLWRQLKNRISFQQTAILTVCAIVLLNLWILFFA